MSMHTPIRSGLRSLVAPAVAAPLLLSAALVSGGCGGDAQPTIGLVLPLSGPSAVYGESVERGVRLAHHALQGQHEQGAYPYDLVLLVEDSAGDAGEAARELGTLYENDVVATIGGVTDAEIRAMAEVARAKERVLVSPTALGGTSEEPCRHVFRLHPSAAREADKMGNFALLELDLESSVILSPKGTDSADLVGAFRTQFERGGQVLEVVEYLPAEGAVAEAVATALSRRPQAVYLAVSEADPAARELLRELDRRHYRGAVLTTSAFAAPGVVPESGHAGEGLILSHGSFDLGSDEPAVTEFVEAYKAEYGEMPDTYAAYGYDSMMVLAQALVEEEASPYQLWKGLKGLSGYRGVTGFIQFDEQGEVGQFPRVFVVRGGKLAPFNDLDDRTKRRLVHRVSLAGSGARSAAVG